MCVAAGIFSLVIYILMTATSLASAYFLTGQLTHALQGAVVLGSTFSDDLRQAVRDPATGVAIRTQGASLAFYRGVPKPGRRQLRVVPVRWSLVAHASGVNGFLERTTWDVERGAWSSTRYEWAPIPMPGASGERIGFQVTGDAASKVQTVLLTVLARRDKVEGTPGSGQDRVSVQIAVAVPELSRHAIGIFQPIKKLDELPPE